MIGLDTNILLRYVLADDVAQHRAAARLIDEDCSIDAPALVSDIVLVETVWFLTKRVRRPKRDVIDLLFNLADNAHLQFRSEDVQLAAINAYAEGQGDFAEYLIAASNAADGAETTYTFDIAASKEGRLTLLAGE